MVISKNIIFNLFSRVINSFGQILFIPFYIEILGIDNYSKIILIVTFVTFFSVFEFGIGQTIIRELGKFKEVSKDILSRVFGSSEVLIIILCSLLSILILLAFAIFDFSISGFSNFNDLILLTVALACSQIIFNFYFQINFIRENQNTPNVLSVMYAIFKQLIVIFPLIIYPSIELFLLWQITINIIFAIIFRITIKRLYNLKRVIISFKDISEFVITRKHIFFPLFLISLVNVILTQSDKMLVGTSNFELFKFYALGSLLASSVVIISNAIGTSYFSKLYGINFNSAKHDATQIFYQVFYALIICLIPFCVIMGSLSNEILLIWLRNEEFVNETILIFNFLLLANFFTIIQVPSFHLFISKGLPKYNLYFGIASASILLPSYYYLSSRGFILEIAITYMIAQAIISIGYTYLSQRILNWEFKLNKIFLYPLLYVLSLVLLSICISMLSVSDYGKISISLILFLFFGYIVHKIIYKFYANN